MLNLSRAYWLGHLHQLAWQEITKSPHINLVHPWQAVSKQARPEPINVPPVRCGNLAAFNQCSLHTGPCYSNVYGTCVIMFSVQLNAPLGSHYRQWWQEAKWGLERSSTASWMTKTWRENKGSMWGLSVRNSMIKEENVLCEKHSGNIGANVRLAGLQLPKFSLAINYTDASFILYFHS